VFGNQLKKSAHFGLKYCKLEAIHALCTNNRKHRKKFSMSFLFIGIGLLVLFFIIKGLSGNKSNSTKNPAFIQEYSPNGRIWIEKMKELYDSGETWSRKPELLYENHFNLNLPVNEYGNKVSAYWNDIGIPKDYIEADESSTAYKLGSYFHDMGLVFGLRHTYQFSILNGKTESEAMDEYGLNIHSDEVIYYRSIKIDWYEEKIVRTNVRYSGLQYRAGENISLASGNLSYVKDEVKDYVLLDRGTLYITNKRVIFTSGTKTENRSVNINDILELSIYNDEVLLGKANGKKPLIFVPDFKEGLLKRDNLNYIIRVLQRVMSKTESIDLTPADYDKP
jgi:hypothetical protein